MERKKQVHEFASVYDKESQILILGSFPSVKSREQHFYYGHPQNRFWRVLACLAGTPLPQTIEEKTAFLHTNHIALWDVIESCEIAGSSDSSIRNVVPNDIAGLLAQTQVEMIFANGGTAKKLYDKYVLESTRMPAIQLPSTSPANAVFTLDRLVTAWSDAVPPHIFPAQPPLSLSDAD
ncbi:DNA-deoxyinosine glycosylase [Hespellia stercorisuis]|uniref:G/U mismatch-specific uracil-DNA glycosylase n=1 Tax=Hespellia stercorisuis DSM 15480 TaxID=1121950 RepID=A0A1M6WHS8_9FIRM|nr:DNA-deoxyinosine glycosylase [Hespellia stercorisuis]SHK93085.1 G/U mismatch-specific uracil-DNA glycosylase [Hespellia stercorisuis DSM 15480]